MRSRWMGVTPDHSAAAAHGWPMRPLVIARPVMGTLVQLSAYHLDPQEARRGIEAGFACMRRVDRLMSRFRTNSEISRLNRLAGQGGVPISPETAAVLGEALDIARLSAGALDITVGPLIALWGLAARRGRVPTPGELDATLARVGHGGLDLSGPGRAAPPGGVEARLHRAGMAVDVGGVAKGFAADLAAEALQRAGVVSGLVDAGGDLRVLGRRPGGGPWRLGLRHPLAPEQLLLTVAVETGGVATSGNYAQYAVIEGRRYGHLLDPRTGAPADRLLSTTVLAPTAVRADALATAAMICGTAERLLEMTTRAGGEGVAVSTVPRRPGWVRVQATRGVRDRLELLMPRACVES